MNISPINNSQIQNKQNPNFKAFLAGNNNIRSINTTLGFLPDEVKKNFYIYKMRDVINMVFKDAPEKIKLFEFPGKHLDDMYITKMEAKALEDGPAETMEKRFFENIQQAKLCDPVKVVRMATDVVRERFSARSIQNLKRELTGRNVAVYTMKEACLKVNEISENGRKVIDSPCLGEFMSNVQIEALKSLKEYGNTSISGAKIQEAKAEHADHMYDYLDKLIRHQR